MTQHDNQERERGAQAETGGGALGQADDALSEGDPHLLRIRRLGQRLFGVSNCVVSLGDNLGSNKLHVAERTLEAVEEAFCRALALSATPVAVRDTRAHPSLREHRCVAGAPYIRFYAAHPVRNQAREVAGSIALVDYAPRPAFIEADCAILADLAALVERELHLRHVNASQLDLQKKNKSLRRKSLIDPLIGIWNRGAIMRILGIESTRCDKAGLPLSLIVADLDHFKQINDRFGHPAGDAVLVKVASRLRACVRPQEALGRYGGEEFLVVLPGSSHDTAMAVAERMRAAVAAEPEVVGDTPLKLTISAGVASTDLFRDASAEELISRADVALYAAKNAGRNCVVKATPNSL